MSDDNVIRVPRVTRTGPDSMLSVWPADENGITTTEFHSLAQPVRPTPRLPRYLDAIRAAFRSAVLSDDMFAACETMEKAVGMEEPFVVRRCPEMAWYIDFWWGAFREPADRGESLRHWLAVELLWPRIKIGKETPSKTNKEISEAPA